MTTKQKPRIILRNGRWWAGVDLKERGSLLIGPLGGIGTGVTPREAYQDWRSKQPSLKAKGRLQAWLHMAAAV